MYIHIQYIHTQYIQYVLFCIYVCFVCMYVFCNVLFCMYIVLYIMCFSVVRKYVGYTNVYVNIILAQLVLTETLSK